MRARSLTLLVTLSFALPSVATAQAMATQSAAPVAKALQLPTDSLERARSFARWMYAGMNDSLFAHMDSASQKSMGSARAMDQNTVQLAARAGTETSLLSERWVTRNGKRQYWRTSQMSIFPQPFLLRFVMDEKGLLQGVGMGPASNAPPVDP